MYSSRHFYQEKTRKTGRIFNSNKINEIFPGKNSTVKYVFFLKENSPNKSKRRTQISDLSRSMNKDIWVESQIQF